MDSTTTHVVERDLVITRAMHRQPIDVMMKRLAGIDEDEPPERLCLVALTFVAYIDHKSWKVYVITSGVVVGSIRLKPVIARTSVLDEVDRWIRTSEHIEFVKGAVHEVPVYSGENAEAVVRGFAIVRGDLTI